MEDVYIAGEPYAELEASLIVAFIKHPDIVTDPDQLDYEEEKDRFFERSWPYLQVDFSQVNMKKGAFDRITKVFKVEEEAAATGISLSKNKLIDRNDSFGLIHTELEPKTFFSVEQKIRDYTQNWLIDDYPDILSSAFVFHLADISKTYER